MSAAAAWVVGGLERVVLDVAKGGVVHVGRDAGRAVRGAEGPDHPARAFGLGDGELVGHGAGDFGRCPVHIGHSVLEAVVGLGDRGGGEGVGGQEVGPGGEERTVNVGNCLRAGERQHVVVASQLVAVIGKACAAVGGLVEAEVLHAGAHGSVDHQDALGHGGSDSGSGGVSPIEAGVWEVLGHDWGLPSD